MNTLQIRLLGDLNDFLPQHLREQAITISFGDNQSLKHLIESMGVPHPEISRILVNSQETDPGDIAQPDTLVEVIPYEPGDPRIRPPEIRFVLDCHLGKLASYLRILGFDVAYANDAKDETLAKLSDRENRILLTRDRGLLKRKSIQFGYCIRSQNPRSQLLGVLQRYDLRGEIDPFTRCPVCNGCLQPVAKSDLDDLLPANTRIYFDRFWQCVSCKKVYWQGSHYQRIQDWLKAFLEIP
ncbi:MAG TPA: Mut7-C RNAse domain-containing protein [Longilinea sp.]|nr:Mut7-C RNAse domain-containing protein [Longilinea sp.]